MATIELSHYEPFFIEELSSLAGQEDKTVKILGRVVISCDPETEDAIVISPKKDERKFQLRVKTELLPLGVLQSNSLYQFFGEIQPSSEDDDGNVTLQAKIARCVDGIDVNLYYEAIKLQRQFFK